LDVSACNGLIDLRCSNNPLSGKFLKQLEYMVNLEYLDINNTNIDSGLEYLPESVKYFKCSADQSKDAKCQAIYILFANKRGKVEKDDFG